jgi:hypothetical protein
MVAYTITGLNARGRAVRVATEDSAWKACLRFGEMEARHGRAYVCGADGREIDATELMICAEVEDAQLTFMDRNTLMPGGATAETVQNCRAHSVRLAAVASHMTDLRMQAEYAVMVREWDRLAVMAEWQMSHAPR